MGWSAGGWYRADWARVAGRTVGAIISLSVLLGAGYGWYEYRSLKTGMKTFHLHQLGQPPSGTSSARPVHGKDQNVLLVGLDSRDGLSPAEQHLLKVGSDQSLSTDTIMVLHVPADGRRATMISIPRDSYVDIDGYAKNKINAAYADAYSDAEKKGATHEEAERAGADLLVETVRKLTGLRIDHYVQVGFGGFYTIAKALGSIPVTLCAATDDSFARNRADGQSGGSGFKMSAGRHDLDPVQALKFVRQRHYLHGGDLAREKRQRYFIGAAFDKIATAGVLLDPAKVGALIKAVHGAFYVDSGFDPLSFAKQLVDLSADKITGFTIPTQGEAQVSILGTIQDVVLVDPAKVQGAIADRLNPPPTSTSSSTAPPGPTASPGPPTPSGHSAAPVAKGCVY